MSPRATLSPLLAGALLALAGCNLPNVEPASRDAVRYFTLASVPVQFAPPGNVMVRPVRLAGYLENHLVVIRVSDHEVRYADDAHWAEPLDSAVTSLLAAHLRALPMATPPTSPAGYPKDYAVRVKVLACEGVEGGGPGSVRFAASYEIFALADETVVAGGEFTAKPRAWDGRSYDQLVLALRDAVGELGDAVAASVPKKP